MPLNLEMLLLGFCHKSEILIKRENLYGSLLPPSVSLQKTTRQDANALYTFFFFVSTVVYEATAVMHFFCQFAADSNSKIEVMQRTFLRSEMFISTFQYFYIVKLTSMSHSLNYHHQLYCKFTHANVH